MRRFLRAWGLWLLLAGAAWLSWRLLAHYDLAALTAKAATGGMSFGAGVLMWGTRGPVAADQDAIDNPGGAARAGERRAHR